LKRLFDIVCSSLGVILLSPVIIVIAAIILIEDRFPVFYRGVRVGRYGKLFRIYKYRSMVRNAESVGGDSTADDDPRITRIGKFLRKYKLDELPQLINVLKGDMSIVGPRPEIKKYVDQYNEEEKQILTVRPGITDWASIWNADEGALLAGAKDPDRAYEELIRPTKLKLQLKYVRERSFFTDMKIIFLTMLAVIQPESKALKQFKISGTL
jgi:lipopolysaccharide/colanic/teichoic acid biosynthesis glycosyltransferase